MTTGSALYLILCLAMFGAFSAVLAYESWRQPKAGPETASEPALAQEPDDTVVA